MTPIARQLAGKHVLLTGATGFVGKVWMTLVLDKIPSIGRLSLVVRPRGRKQSGTRRFERICDTSPCLRPLRERYGSDLGRFLGARLKVYDGDVEKPLLGLSTDDVEGLMGTVDVVIHCAGITDSAPDPLKALRINVNGARHAAQLARKLGAPLVHVSTCFVAGMVSGPVAEELEPGVSPNGTRFDIQGEIRALAKLCKDNEEVSERKRLGEAQALRLGWPNLYTFSKGLAEHLVATTAGVDWTIVRPAIVECARTYPFEGWNEGLNTAGPLAWLITTPFRNLPTQADNHFDVVPVDDVARGLTLIAAAAIRGEAGGVWHLASSDANPLRFGRCVELTGLGMRRWTRKGGGTAADKLWIKHLDPVPVPQDGQGILAPDVVRPLVKRAVKWLRKVDDRFGEPVADGAARARAKLGSADQTLGQVEAMLRLFKPFIHDYDPVFSTGRIRGLAAAEQGDFSWDVPQIDWRRYWVDIEYPGLQLWSIPAIRGEAIPTDPSSSPPLRFEDVIDERQRAASK